MSRRVLLTGLTMLVGATPVPSQLLIRDERYLYYRLWHRP